MQPSTQRAFIALDEWLGMLLSVYLFQTSSSLFWFVCPLWIIAVYGISYPFYWWGREDKQRPTPFQLALTKLAQLARRPPRHRACSRFVEEVAQQPCDLELMRGGCEPARLCLACQARSLRGATTP